MSSLAGHQRIAIDSNVLIYLFEDSGRLADRAASVLDAIAAEEFEGVMSALCLTEICTRPAMAKDFGLVERYADEIRSLENMRIVPLGDDVAVDAAVLRGAGSRSLADAIHLACARSAGATAFVTNDHRIKALPHLDVLYLDELE